MIISSPLRACHEGFFGFPTPIEHRPSLALMPHPSTPQFNRLSAAQSNRGTQTPGSQYQNRLQDSPRWETDS